VARRAALYRALAVVLAAAFAAAPAAWPAPRPLVGAGRGSCGRVRVRLVVRRPCGRAHVPWVPGSVRVGGRGCLEVLYVHVAVPFSSKIFQVHDNWRDDCSDLQRSDEFWR